MTLPRRRVWALLAVVLVLPLLVSPAGVGGTADSYSVLVSLSPDRSGPVELEGKTVSGSVYVFSSPDTSDIKRVRFWLDNTSMSGPARQVENNAPYDFAGGTVSTANPFNTGTVADGPHSITAAIEFTNGSQSVVHANFTVQNTSTTPSLGFDPSSLSLAAEEGGAAVSQTATLSASDGGGASFTISENAAWLTVTPGSGTTPATLTFTADPAGLAAGSYSETVTAQASGYTSASIPVTLTVTAAGQYSLLVSTSANRADPAQLDGATVSGNIYVFTSPDTSEIKRVRFWLDNTAMSGPPRQTENTAPYDFASGTVTTANPFNTTTISDGPHTITAAIELKDGSQTVLHAGFTVQNTTPSLAFDPSSLSFTSGEDADPSSQTANLTASSGSASYTTSTNAAWLTAAPTNGTTPAALTITADPTGLDPGTYTGTITAQADGHNGASLTVTLTIASAGEYTLLVSSSADRASPVPLDGKTVSGKIYAFTSPDTAEIKRVRFWLDNTAMSGPPRQTENTAPYDFAGGTVATANPFDTTTVSDGQHTITAAIELTNGSQETLNATLFVQNTGSPSLVFDPSAVSISVAENGDPKSQQVELSTTGAAASFTITDDSSWLTVSPSSGSTPAMVTVTADPAGLALGTYTGTVTATAAGFQNATLSVTLTVAESTQCTPISTLPCVDIMPSVPYQLDFDSSEGMLGDGDGDGTGFTMVDPPTNGTGYLPANLDVATASPGTLRITTTSGIAYTSTNSQDNTLGIGVDAPDQISILDTTLLDPPAGTGQFEQGGLWLGNNEDNYVKLVVISMANGPHVQFLLELGGTERASAAQAVSLPAASISLRLRADPSNLSVSAWFSVGGGAFTSLGTVTANGEFFSSDAAGIDPRIGTRTFGGIFATHRTGPSSLTYVFDDFSLTAEAVAPPPATSFSFTRKSFSIPNPTAMVFGPDGRLYVTELFGKIHALTIDADHQLVSDQVITTLGSRLTLGITVDPDSTPSNVILWTAHSSPSLNAGEVNSSTVTRLSGTGFTTKQDVITGLPRALANHAINEIHFGPDGRLYIAQGGNTGAGAPNTETTEFGDRPEQPLSAALLVADVKAAGFQGSCATPIGEFGVPSTCDVEVYSSGLRNMYDFVWHSNGSLYGPDNGLGVTGTYPPVPTPPCTGLADANLHNPGEQPDLLMRLEPGRYYGHPNPYRDECVYNDGSYQNVAPLPNYAQPMFNLGLRRSANGIIEYKGSAFGGGLKGNLLIANYSQGDNIQRIVLSSDGRSVVSSESLAGSFADPLPLVEGPDGTIYVGEFGGSRVTALIPDQPLGTWETKTSMPEAILDAGGAALGGKLYAVAGKTSTAYRTGMYVYDPVADTWSTGPSLPSGYPGVEDIAVVAYNSKLYAFGGATAPFSGAVTNAAVFDPVANSWSEIAPMPTERTGAGVAALGDKIYLVGGMDGSGASLSSVAIYDPATDTWASGPSMGTRRDNPVVAALDAKLYVFGGRTRNADGTEVNGTLSSVEMLDPAVGTWTARASMPTGRRRMALGLLHGRAQLIGGERTPTGGAFSQNEEYDPVTNAWRSLAPLPTPRQGAAFGTIDGVVYLAGGGTTGGSSFSAITEAFSY